jgi:hypothetical protein
MVRTMPTGRLKWFDPTTEQGRVTRYGKEYPILPGEAERDARAKRAPVHFDVRRRDGIDWAVHVRLRRGTRVGRLQHRFGDLVKTPSHHRSGERDPSTVAALWLQAVAAGDASAAALLYAPDACLHVRDAALTGRDRIRRRLANDPIFTHGVSGSRISAEDDRTIVVHWQPGDDVPPASSRLRVERGEIEEQWF